MELAYIIYPDKSREDARTLHREMIIKHLDLDISSADAFDKLYGEEV